MGGQCTKSAPSSVDDVHSNMQKHPEGAHHHLDAIHNMEEALQFPPWCFKDVTIDEHIRQTVNTTWKKVLSGECRPFKEAKAVRPNLTPLAFFYNVFYDSFFSLVPESLPLYIRGIQTQGRMLAHIIHFIVTNLDCGDEFDATLQYLAVMHNQRAVNPCHYGTMGLCLLFSIRRVVGDENFDADARYCWTCLYSRMMQVIIPLAVSKKMEHDKEVLQKMYHYKILDSIAGSEDSESTISRNAGPGNVPLTPQSLSLNARGRNPPLTPNMNNHIITHEEEPESPRNPPPRLTLGIRAQKNSGDGLPDPESANPKALEKNAAIAARLMMSKGSKKEVSRTGGGDDGDGPYVALHPDVAGMEDQINQTYLDDIDSPRGPPPPPPPEDDDTPLPPPNLPTTPMPAMPARSPPAVPSASSSPTPSPEPATPVPEPSPKPEVPSTDVSITGQVFNRSIQVHINPHAPGGGMYGSLRQKHIPNAPVGVNAPAPPMGAPVVAAVPAAKTPRSVNRPSVSTTGPAAPSAAVEPRPSPKEMEADAKSFASAMQQMSRQRQASATNLNMTTMNMGGGVMSGRHVSPNAGLIPHSPV